MRFYEFASADDKLELWRVIDKEVWKALDQKPFVRPTWFRPKPSQPKARTPTKSEFRRRGTQLAAANSRDDIDPDAHAAEQLHKLQQQRIQKQQELVDRYGNAAVTTSSTVSNNGSQELL